MIPPATVSIRPFRLSDAEPVWNLCLRALRKHPNAFGEPYESAATLGPDEVRERVDSLWTSGDNCGVIATVDDRNPGGMLGMHRQQRPRERHRMGIWGVYVVPEHRGSGISARLMIAALTFARSIEGILQIGITVNSNNHVAKSSYQKHGFGTWGIMPRAEILEGAPMDMQHMILMLDTPASPSQPEGTR